MGLQKHMTLKLTKLLKQPNIKLSVFHGTTCKLYNILLSESNYNKEVNKTITRNNRYSEMLTDKLINKRKKIAQKIMTLQPNVTN